MMAGIMRVPKLPRLLVYIVLLCLISLLWLLSYGINDSIVDRGVEQVATVNNGTEKLKLKLDAHNNTIWTDGPRILLVTALYPLTKSKHSNEEYAHWLELFLSRIQTDIYFYAPEQLRSHVLDTAAKLVTDGRDRRFTLNTTYNSPFSVPPLFGLRRTYEEMHKTDREKEIHGAELYAVWNAKAFFLDEAVESERRGGRLYDYAFWIDAGSFRTEHAYTAWPDIHQIEAIFKGHEDRVFFSIRNAPSMRGKSWTDDMGPFDEDVSQGAFFGGPISAVAWFRETFYAYHDRYLSKSFFVGVDQAVFNSILLSSPFRFLTVWMNDPASPARQRFLADLANGGFKHKLLSTLPTSVTGVGSLGRCKDRTYYYHFCLASEGTREKMRDMWDTQDLTDGGFWSSFLGVNGGSWMERTRCRTASISKLEEVLHRIFGEHGASPVSNVSITSG